MDTKQETIRTKTEELRRKYDALVAEKQTLKDEAARLQRQIGSTEADDHKWQKEGIAGGSSYSLLHVIIAAIICLYLGHFLAAVRT